MKPGDLIRVKWAGREIYPAHSKNDRDEFTCSFYPQAHEIGIMIDPYDMGDYSKILMRNQLVWIYYSHIKAINETG